MKKLFFIPMLYCCFYLSAQNEQALCTSLKYLIDQCDNNFADITGELILSDMDDLIVTNYYDSKEGLEGSMYSEISYINKQWTHDNYMLETVSEEEAWQYFDELKQTIKDCLGESYVETELFGEDLLADDVAVFSFSIDYLKYPDIVISLAFDETYLIIVQIYSPYP